MRQSAEIALHARVGSQRSQTGREPKAAGAVLVALDEDEALADLGQDVDVHRLVGVQAHQHQVALVAQAAKELEHEADAAVLGVELRFVEQVHQGALAAGALHQEAGLEPAEIAYLVRLVVVHRQPVALGRARLAMKAKK